jgi:hypothetical protein
MINVRLLPGLPPYPPPARAFPPEWGARGHEGIVFEFTSDTHSWTGNFAPGLSQLSAALQHPDGIGVLVLADGDVWSVDPEAETAELVLCGATAVWPVANPDGYILNLQGLAFARLGPRGILWHTRRLSWDGFKDVDILETLLTGAAWSPVSTPNWVPFEVDLSTGRSTGGSFDVPGSLTSDWERLASDESAT